MTKLMQRLLVFFIGVPLLLLLVYIPYQNHLLLHIALFTVTILAVLELYAMFSSKTSLQPRPFIIILSLAFSLVSYFSVFFTVDNLNIHNALIFITIALIIFEIFYTNKKEEQIFEKAIERITFSFFIVFYCGFLFSYISKIASLPYSQIYLVIFLAFVFGCDSFAWLFGMLFGNGNRNIFTVSKKKSLAGFIGGILGTILLGVIAKVLFPEAFPGPIYKIIILASISSITAVMGDLFESILKRSAELKDSGTIVPGRGGILDSIDSMIFTAPLYYFCLILCYGA